MQIATARPGSTQLAAQSLAEQAARDARWAYLMEGIKSPRERALIAQLLDNQVRAGLYEDDTTADIPTFTTIALAFIPKVYPALLLNRIASVQPMMGPTAKVFFEDFVSDFSAGATSFTHGEVAALADATTAPTVAANGAGSNFQAGDWYVGYTFYTATGETKMSAITKTTLTAGQNLRVSAITLPTGATGIRYYVSVGAGSTVLKFAVSQASGAQIDITAAPLSNVADPPLSNTTSPTGIPEGGNVPKSRYKLTSSTVTAIKYALQVQWTTELQQAQINIISVDRTLSPSDVVARLPYILAGLPHEIASN